MNETSAIFRKLYDPGTYFAYSQVGYDLLARIVEKTSGKSFVAAGAFISTAGAPIKWNTCLHNGRLPKTKTSLKKSLLRIK